MKRCNHTYWLGLCNQTHEDALLQSDRLLTLTKEIHNPYIQKPSLIVLIGNRAKSVALQQLFQVKRRRTVYSRRTAGEIHLHTDSSAAFQRPIFIADADFPNKHLRLKSTTANKCHETTRWVFQGGRGPAPLTDSRTTIYTHLLFPFVDVFCFFSTDLGGFRQTACHVAAWLERGSSSAIPKCTHPKIVVVSDKIPPGTENEAKRAFLWLLAEETAKDPFEQFSAIEIVALLPSSTISDEARHRLLKERILDASDEVRQSKEVNGLLFSAVHFGALFDYACKHFAATTEHPFDFIKASRTHNPVAPDLEEHMCNLLRHIKEPTELTDFAVPIIASSFLFDNYPPGAHMFNPVSVFRALYEDFLLRVSDSRVIAFEGSTKVILRSGFIKMIENHFCKYFTTLRDGKSSAEIHKNNLERFKDQWSAIHSDSTCFPCIRRRPQHGFACGHIICQSCVRNFGAICAEDPWEMEVDRCLLCTMVLPEKVVIRVHPPTTGAGVLCIDGGGTRGMVPLSFMKRIHDRVGLPIPFQRFFKVAFGVSSGALIVLAMFHNGWSIDDSAETFEKLANLAFKRRKVLNLPFLSRIQEILTSYFTDGLYPAKNIETALKEVFGVERSILDNSFATLTGTRIGLPVATVKEKPSCRIFTNYNGIGTRDQNQNHAIKPKDGFGRVPVWEIARAASAAPGFFPPKHIDNVGTFQDAGPLENDPILSALSETAITFPLAEEPDFVVSLGTGEPKLKNDDCSADTSSSVRKNGAFPRLCRMFWEKMRDRKLRQAFQGHPRYHRLDVEFDQSEPRLDDITSMSELQSKAQNDSSISLVIDKIAHCMVASMFYFELDSKPEKVDGKFVGTGHIYCEIRRHHPAFILLLHQLASTSTTFYVNDLPIPGTIGDDSFLDADGNFGKLVKLEVDDNFSISIKRHRSAACKIGGSPYSVKKMELAQGLDAPFGTADHRKRKRSGDDGMPARKLRRI